MHVKRLGAGGEMPQEAWMDVRWTSADQQVWAEAYLAYYGEVPELGE